MAFGCENEVREYAVGEVKYELMKKIPTKIALTTPQGEPFVNNQPVSLVRPCSEPSVDRACEDEREDKLHHVPGQEAVRCRQVGAGQYASKYAGR